MVEADTLGDKVVIMKHGALAVIGTSLQLKNKFGAGYVCGYVVACTVQASPVAEEYVPTAIDVHTYASIHHAQAQRAM
jgi:ABC-type multidrug transport system ATPase subunit